MTTGGKEIVLEIGSGRKGRGTITQYYVIDGALWKKESTFSVYPTNGKNKDGKWTEVNGEPLHDYGVFNRKVKA